MRSVPETRCNPDDITIYRVPGGFEMPIAAQKVAQAGGVDAIIALGAVIEARRHFDFVANEATKGLQRYRWKQATDYQRSSHLRYDRAGTNVRARKRATRGRPSSGRDRNGEPPVNLGELIVFQGERLERSHYWSSLPLMSAKNHQQKLLWPHSTTICETIATYCPNWCRLRMMRVLRQV